MSDLEKYRDEINAIKKDISYMPLKPKKTWRGKILLYKWNAYSLKKEFVYPFI